MAEIQAFPLQHVSDADLDTSILIARLTLKEIEEGEMSRKGKGRADAPLSDQDVALQSQAESLQSLLGLLNDYQMALSLSSALDSDLEQLEVLSNVEQAEHDDRQAALALSRGEVLPNPTAAQRSLEDPSTGITLKTDDLETLSEASDETSVASSITVLPPRSGPSGPSRLECVICTDAVTPSRSFHAPCGDRYCRHCLINLVEASTRDESLYPLRCCHQNLAVEKVFPFLKPALLSLFRAKSVEFGTPAGNRIYCTKPACSAFLGPSDDSRANIVCTRCNTVVCSSCKNVAHPNEDCTDNAATLEVKALAQDQHWQTCPGCSAIVELNHGCNHITCRCGTQFCYLCAARWKNCGCSQWDEQLLLDAANRRVVNEFGERAAVNRPAVHEERVQQRMAELRVNHDCVYHNWQYRHGGGQCNECNFNLPMFMMRCTNCQILVCKRCSRNRL